MPKYKSKGLRGKWNADNMQNALTAIRNGYSVNKASINFAIPRRTLRDYIKKNVAVKLPMGRKCILNSDEESNLCQRIIRLAEIGYPLTSRVLRRCVYNFCITNQIKTPFSETSKMAGRYWLKGFLKRHDEIRNRKAQNLNPARAQKLNKFIVNDHFNKLKDIMQTLEIMNKPQCIYNMDEKGCRLTLHHQQSVLAKKGARRVHVVANEHAQNVTVVSCANAIGSVIPPVILFKGKRLKPEWTDQFPPGGIALMTPKGSMTIESFKVWLKHFSKYKAPGPCLLIFDGASSHLDYSIVQVADELNITLYCLPSNTTHELQPMDKAVFRSFEHYWDDEVLKYWTKNIDRSITKQRFGAIFSEVWDKSLTPANIKSGFQATGIYPFNQDVIPVEAFAPSSITENKNLTEDIEKIQPPESLSEAIQPPKHSSPQASTSKMVQVKKNPTKKRIARELSESSDDSDDISVSNFDSSEESENEESESENTNNLGTTSFSEMLPTPDFSQKSTKPRRNPAINSRAQVLKKDLFSSLRNEKKNKPSNRKIDHKKTCDKESWFCKACKEDRVADMRLCSACNSYLHDECIGLTKSDKIVPYICPYCS